MKLPIEDWIGTQNLHREARDLLLEATKCYRATAYQAAYLMSYLGFQREIRARILGARKPSNYSAEHWRQLRDKLLDNEKWDSAVYDALKRQGQGEVFRLTDDMRRQITYWKDRRNDCAHAKDNEVGMSHVESFWVFLKSNLGKCVVNGSQESLLNKIRVCFDRSFTPSGQDPTGLTNQIPYAVDPAGMDDFFLGLEEVTRAKTEFRDPDVIAFYNAIFDIDDERTLSGVKNYLAVRNSKLMLSIFRQRPDRIQGFAHSAEFVRHLWHALLFKDISSGDMVIYCALLRNELIPPEQLNEAHETVILRGPPPPQNDECDELLTKTGFYRVLYRCAFEDGNISNFGFGNGNSALLAHYVRTHEIDKTMAKAISSTFSSRYCPYDLRDALNSLFSKNEPKRQECQDVMASNNISLPTHLGSLKDRPLSGNTSDPINNSEEDIPF